MTKWIALVLLVAVVLTISYQDVRDGATGWAIGTIIFNGFMGWLGWQIGKMTR